MKYDELICSVSATENAIGNEITHNLSSERLSMNQNKLQQLIANNAEMLNVQQAAQAIGVAVATLNCWRQTGRHALPYVKIGHLVRYRPNDIEAWLNKRTAHIDQAA